MGVLCNRSHIKSVLATIFLGLFILCVEGGLKNETSDWEPPLELQKLYPYVVSGFDREGSPVWVIEVGKWDIRSTMERGGQIVQDFANYTGYHIEKMYDSPSKYNTGRDDFVVILDMDGFSSRQFSHLPTVGKYLDTTRQFAVAERQRKHSSLKLAIILNANYLFQSLYLTLRPVLGEVATKFEVYGTNSEKWKPLLLQKIARDQLPEWLGGEENHVPIQVYG